MFATFKENFVKPENIAINGSSLVIAIIGIILTQFPLLVEGDTLSYKVTTRGEDFCGSEANPADLLWTGKVCDSSGSIEWNRIDSVSGHCNGWKRKISDTTWNTKYIGSCGKSPTYIQMPTNVKHLISTNVVNVHSRISIIVIVLGIAVLFGNLGLSFFLKKD